MDFAKLPIGFAMALAQNEIALNKYGAMSEAQKNAILDRAHTADSNEEMHQIVADITKDT